MTRILWEAIRQRGKRVYPRVPVVLAGAATEGYCRDSASVALSQIVHFFWSLDEVDLKGLLDVAS